MRTIAPREHFASSTFCLTPSPNCLPPPPPPHNVPIPHHRISSECAAGTATWHRLLAILCNSSTQAACGRRRANVAAEFNEELY